jgi:hypothetical protein
MKILMCGGGYEKHSKKVSATDGEVCQYPGRAFILPVKPSVFWRLGFFLSGGFEKLSDNSSIDLCKSPVVDSRWASHG